MSRVARTIRVSIIGTVGVPGAYGGFETLADNLIRFFSAKTPKVEASVFCSSIGRRDKREVFQGAKLRYVPLNANGVQSVPYDIWSMISALRKRDDVLLILGVSGAMFLPMIRLVSRARLITNIDGIEWKREKWKGIARWFLRWSERSAVRWSHVVVSDNDAITEYVREVYQTDCTTIPYGGDHALKVEADPEGALGLPASYALALCRIEPENNVEMILEAWNALTQPLVFVGNWRKSEYGRELKTRFGGCSNIYLLDPVYDPGPLRAIRDRATLYVHGHSAGGTNPSLVEMMHFGIPVVAHGCVFNRKTTEGKARYFLSPEELVNAVDALGSEEARDIGENMLEVARRRYTWDAVGKAYVDLFEA